MSAAAMLRNGHNTCPQHNHRARDQPSQPHGIAPIADSQLKIQS
jgi:hypothetical protein